MAEKSVYGFSDTRPVTHYNLRKNIIVNPYFYGDDWINNDIKRIKVCSLNDIPIIKNANVEANKMIFMPVDKLSKHLKESFNSNSSNSGGGKKKKGGSFTLFLPLAILLAKDTNKAIRAMSKLGIEYIYSWFDVMNELTGCYKYIYDKAMSDIYPYLIYMYNKGHVKEFAPFIINNGPIYFNYVIQKLSDVLTTMEEGIEKDKIEELQKQYQELKSLFEKGKKEDKIITNDIIQAKLGYAGELKTEIDRLEKMGEEIIAEERELTEVEKLITKLEQKRLANEENTINAVLAQEQERTQQIELQKETREKLGMLLEDPIFQPANQIIKQHYKRENEIPVTKSSRKDSFGSKDKLKKTKTIRRRRVDEKELPEYSGGGKRNTKKHYNKKKKTKKHAKKLHRKTKRG